MKTHLKLFFKANAHLFILILVCVSVLYQFQYSPGRLAHQIQNEMSVVSFKPSWIAYQNRLLGPYSHWLLMKMGLSQESAIKVLNSLGVVWVMTLLNYFLYLGFKMKPMARVAWTGLYFVIYEFFRTNNNCFYSWDIFDGVFFLIFSYFVVSKQKMSSFVVLFFAALLNRESALFIAVYLVLSAFSFEDLSLKQLLSGQRINKKLLICGVFLTLFGLVYTKWVRETLFYYGEESVGYDEHRLIGNHFQLLRNLQDLFLLNFGSLAGFIHSTWIFGTLGQVVSYWKKADQVLRKLILIYGVMLLNILIFGLLRESRVYLGTLPCYFFILIYYQERIAAHEDGLGFALQS